MKIDPTLVSVHRRITPHGVLYDIGYNGVVLDGHAIRAGRMDLQRLLSTAHQRLQGWFNDASAHQRLEFWRKTRTRALP